MREDLAKMKFEQAKQLKKIRSLQDLNKLYDETNVKLIAEDI